MFWKQVETQDLVICCRALMKGRNGDGFVSFAELGGLPAGVGQKEPSSSPACFLLNSSLSPIFNFSRDTITMGYMFTIKHAFLPPGSLSDVLMVLLA